MMIHRSNRVPSDLSLNQLARARAEIGEVPYDLTVSNPTECGFSYPSDLLAPLADSRSLAYEPDPRGATAARDAVASEYQRWGCQPDAGRIVLTASTSEAYGFLFRLFCDPGDAVMVPSPSYPLFDHLAALDGIDAATYALDPDGGWRVDFPALEDAHDRVRAVVVVHPNNPTGSFVHPDDRERLVALCRRRGWALIADEVFLPYPIEGGPGGDATFAGTDDCLCCTMGGLSKSLGLPQLKLAWTVVSGPDEAVERTLEGLEYVADAYLSVSTPVALAASRLLETSASIREAISDRCRANLETLKDRAKQLPAVTAMPVGGGWSVVLRVPATIGDDDLCVKLLRERGVAVHPGGPFGFTRDGWLVVSLLPQPEIFAEGVRRLLDTVTQTSELHSDSTCG